MKFLIVVLILIVAGTTTAQNTAPALTHVIREDSTVVGTTWHADSVNLQSTANEKWGQLSNDGSVLVEIAFGNDTTAGHIIRLFSSSTGHSQFFFARIDKSVTFIRRRATTSTCAVRWTWGY